MRDDAIYAESDYRKFALGPLVPTRADAIRPLLKPGHEVRVEPTGTLRFRLAGRDYWQSTDLHETETSFLFTVDPAEAWRILCAEPSLDPEWFHNLSARLLARDAALKLIPVTHPTTMRGVLALAQAPKSMQQAEPFVKEIYRRLEPFGGGPCPPIFWRSGPDRPFGYRDISVLNRVSSSLYFTLGQDIFKEQQRIAEKGCFIRSIDGAAPPYHFTAEDLTGLNMFDIARRQRLVTQDTPPAHTRLEPSVVGVALAELDSPWEPLMHIQLLGYHAEVLTPDRVVLLRRE